jgi:hypothetical protein
MRTVVIWPRASAQSGMLHYVVPLIIVVLFGLGGVAWYVSSHADSLTAATDSGDSVADVESPDSGGGRVPDAQTQLCGARSWKWVDNGWYVLYNDVYNSSDSECITNANDGANFKVVKSTTPDYAWNAYPNLFNGCWYNVCSQQGPLPEPVSKVKSLTEILTTNYDNVKGVGNDADDFWFSTGLVGDHHPNGAELMIWANWHGVPTPSSAQLVNISGRRWWITEHRTTQNGVSWNYIQLRAYNPGQNDLARIPILPIIQYAEGRGWISKSWYATSFNAGYEIVQNGVGNQTTTYRLDFNGIIGD